MRDTDLPERFPYKSGRRRHAKFKRVYSNSLWHASYEVLPDGRYFVSYQDDASYLIVGYGVFDEATTQHAIDVLHKAITQYGKPASILTDHDSKFYSNENICKECGEACFEQELVRLDIRHILARTGQPHTNSKLERFHTELKRRLHFFEQVAPGREPTNYHVGGPFYTKGRTDPVERFIQWYNNERPYQLLDFENLETPAKAYSRKMAPDADSSMEIEERKE